MDVGTNDDGTSGRHARADDTPDAEDIGTSADAAPTAPDATRGDAAGERTPHEASHRAPDDATDGPSRRVLLAGGIGVGVVLAAGLGGGAALLWPETTRARPEGAPPAALVAAIDTERALIADLDATTGGAASVRRGIAQARADHVAHMTVLRRALARYDRTGTSASPSAAAPRPTGTARTAAELRTAEQDAARDAAGRAAALDGALATLLASISACEATHVRLLA